MTAHSPPHALRPVVVVGTGGHAREIAAAIAAVRCAQGAQRALVFRGFVDDARVPNAAALKQLYGAGVLGTTDWLAEHAESVDVMLGIGFSRVRADVAHRLDKLGVRYATLVHPTAVVSPTARFGAGLYAAARSVVTESVTGGAHVHLNIAATVSHDCALGDFVTLAPGAHLAGAVSVGDCAEIGIGAVAIQGVHLGPRSVLGGGAVAIAAVPEGATAVGVPARVLNRC